MSIVDLYRKIFPTAFRQRIYALFLGNILEYKRNHDVVKSIIDYYDKLPVIPEKERVYVNYMRRNLFFLSGAKAIFFSPFVEKYDKMKVKVYKCKKYDLPYIIHNGKKLYWRKNTSPFLISRAYKVLCAEQDAQSPHLYWSEYSTYENKILFDVGAAEGLITLDRIDVLKYAALFECEKEWVEALNATFEPYKEKVTIVEKYVSDKSDEENNVITIDDFVNSTGVNPDLIKMDIEGYEIKALNGAEKTISKDSNLQLAVCVYHTSEAEEEISDLLEKLDCECKLNDGYMFFRKDKELPFLRHGVIRATRVN